MYHYQKNKNPSCHRRQRPFLTQNPPLFIRTHNCGWPLEYVAAQPVQFSSQSFSTAGQGHQGRFRRGSPKGSKRKKPGTPPLVPVSL